MNERPRWQQILAALGKVLCYLTLFLGWQVLVSMVYTIAVTVVLLVQSPAAAMDETELIGAVMSRAMEISLISNLLTLASVVVFYKLRRKSLRQSVWLRPVPVGVAVWAGLMSFCLYWLVTLALGLLPEDWMTAYGEASAGLEDTGAMSVIATALVAPVVEEVIFRGLIFTRLERVLPGWAAVAISATVFGVCHGEFIWFTYAFFLGCIFALLTQATRSILPGMVMHLVFNTTNEVMLLLGDWEPGVWGYMAIALVAVAGSVFCACQIARILAARPVPFVTVEPGPEGPAAVYRAQAPHPEPEAPAPAQAMWDPDSGMDSRFPIARL